MGVVTGILDDGSFRISYTDGDCESGVPERYIRRMQNRRRPSKAAHPGSRPRRKYALWQSIRSNESADTRLHDYYTRKLYYVH